MSLAAADIPVTGSVLANIATVACAALLVAVAAVAILAATPGRPAPSTPPRHRRPVAHVLDRLADITGDIPPVAATQVGARPYLPARPGRHREELHAPTGEMDRRELLDLLDKEASR